MTKHVCDDCGDDLHASWWSGDKFGQPDLELCKRCYARRSTESMADAHHKLLSMLAIASKPTDKE